MAEVESNESWKNQSKAHYENAINIASELGKNKKTYLGLMLN